MNKPHYTHEELKVMLERLQASMQVIEQANPYAKGLPPMAADEAKELILAYVESSTQRTLCVDEAFLVGQLMEQQQSYFTATKITRRIGARGDFSVRLTDGRALTLIYNPEIIGGYFIHPEAYEGWREILGRAA